MSGNSSWSETIITATHINYRPQISAARNITSYEHWFGQKADISYFRVFDCLAFVYITRELCHKLEEKVSKLVFVGKKGWKFLNLISKRMLVSRDAVFLEDQFMETDDRYEGERCRTSGVDQWCGLNIGLDRKRIYHISVYLTFVYITRELCHKLEEKVSKLVFVGKKGWKFLNLISKRMLVSRDAVFLEDQFMETDDRYEGERCRTSGVDQWCGLNIGLDRKRIYHISVYLTVWHLFTLPGSCATNSRKRLVN